MKEASLEASFIFSTREFVNVLYVFAAVDGGDRGIVGLADIEGMLYAYVYATKTRIILCFRLG